MSKMGKNRGDLLQAEEDIGYLSAVMANREGTYDLKILKEVTMLIHQARNVAQGVETKAKRRVRA